MNLIVDVYAALTYTIKHLTATQVMFCNVCHTVHGCLDSAVFQIAIESPALDSL